MTKLENYNNTIFESIKHTDEDGCEYWYARELMVVLEYGKWQNFEKLIDKMKSDSKIFINIDDMGCNKFLAQTKFKNFITLYIVKVNMSY